MKKLRLSSKKNSKTSRLFHAEENAAEQPEEITKEDLQKRTDRILEKMDKDGVADRKTVSDLGYVSHTSVYSAADCSRCPLRGLMHRSNRPIEPEACFGNIKFNHGFKGVVSTVPLYEFRPITSIHHIMGSVKSSPSQPLSRDFFDVIES